MLYRSLIFLGILSLTAAASADPAATATAAGETSAPPAAAPAVDNPNCLKETGSMIHHKDGCTANGGNGYSFGQDDIRRTGETTMGGALSNLVPAATVTR